MPHPNESKRKN